VPIEMKEHPEHRGYLIGEDGSVFSVRNQRQLSVYVGDTGYAKVKVAGRTKLVHRLVAETYIENPENLPQVNHIDNSRLNNKVENLEWVDNAGNAHHRAGKWLVKNLKSGEERVVKNLHRFCLENNLPKSPLYKVAENGRAYKGEWKVSPFAIP
jgi:hypothetical protein